MGEMPRQPRPSSLKKAAQAKAPEKPATAAEASSVLSKAFGDEWLSWEPETVWSEFKRVFGAISEADKGRVQAVKTLLTTNAFWKDHLVFEKVVMALNGIPVTFDMYQHPSPSFIARAISESKGVREVPFSDEVLAYIATVCYEAGLLVLPDDLAVAQVALDGLSATVVGDRFKDDIRRKWDDVGGVTDGMYAETVTGIQLARMAAVREYVRNGP